MKSFRLLSLSLLVSALSFAFVGCNTTATTTGPRTETKLVAKLAVQYAVISVVNKNPEKAGRVLAISQAVRAVAGGEGFNTVDLLMGYVRVKVNVASLDPANQLLASTLLDAVEMELKARVGTGTLTTDKLLIVGEVAGWIEDAARLVAPPAPFVVPGITAAK